MKEFILEILNKYSDKFNDMVELKAENERLKEKL